MNEAIARNQKEEGLKWEHYLFFALYIISPSYLAVEVSGKLPLFTASRILFILMGAMWILRQRKSLFPVTNMKNIHWNMGLTKDRFLAVGLFVYFILMTICDIALLSADMGESIKALFTVIVESYGMIWLLSVTLDSRKKLLQALKTLVIAAGITGVIVTFGCVFDCNPFYWLDTVSRDMLMSKYYRLGLLRAEGGFGHPVYYGAFCAIIIPINLYFVENNEKRREKLIFSACLVMNLVGLVLSNSRGSLCAFGCLAVLEAIVRIKEKKFLAFCKTYIPLGLIAVCVLAVVALTSPGGLAFLKAIFASIVNTIVPDTMSTDIVVSNKTVVFNEITQTYEVVVEEEIISYGTNASGGRSRKAQLTGILWTLQQNPLFGLGSNAHKRGLVFYQETKGIWTEANTFDVALVSIICQFGILGFIGHVFLYGSILRSTALKVYGQDRLMHFLGLAFVGFLLCLITISSLDKVAWVLFGMIVCLCNIIRKEIASSK